MNIEREKLMQKDRAEDKKLKAAIANRNKYSKTTIDKKALKK